MFCVLNTFEICGCLWTYQYFNILMYAYVLNYLEDASLNNLCILNKCKLNHLNVLICEEILKGNNIYNHSE